MLLHALACLDVLCSRQFPAPPSVLWSMHYCALCDRHPQQVQRWAP